MHGLGRKLMIAPFLVETAVDDARDLCPADGAGTHHTRLDGDIERTLVKVFPAQEVCCRGDGLHLGMSRHVAERLCEVVAAGDDAVLAHDDGTDGNLALLIGHTGFVERPLHVEFVFFLLFLLNHAAKLQNISYLCKRIMDFKIIHIEETDSTNRWLMTQGDGSFVTSRDVTKEPSPCVIVVVADYQTAGRGCGNNSWESERGKNLTFSMLIHPDGLPANEQFHITEVVSVALCETLEAYIYNKVEIKWPNDIYVGDRKICGILIENRLQGSVIKDSIIGIGLNVNQCVFLSDAPNPVSLYQLTGQETDRDALLQQFLTAVGRVAASSTVSEDYRARLYRKGIAAPYEDSSGRFMATLIDVEPDGRLVLQDEAGQEHTYAFKEVQFVIKSPND